jgi:peroxiredoxin Q/BCP
VVLGISSDAIESHQRFSAKYRLNFPLLADVGGKVCRAYGAQRLWGLVRRRITYVVDAQGFIQMIFDSMSDPERHVDEAFKALKG